MPCDLGLMELQGRFEELMNKSPINGVDVKTYLREMRRVTSGTQKTARMIAAKIQGSSEAQAIQAFDVLETCLSSETEGSIEFRTEVGRFRFLNEVIRILSPKYMGDSTPPAVKERALKFLEDAVGPKRKTWFPSEHSKIMVAYQSLVETGVIKPNPTPFEEDDEEAELQKSIFDRAENAEVLRKLLHSTDPKDVQAANRLIKNLVAQESKRIERRAELHSIVDRIDTSATLLVEMLSPQGGRSSVEWEIVDDLVEGCKNLREKLGGVATESSYEAGALLNASEKLEKALELYEDKKNNKDIDDTEGPGGQGSDLLSAEGEGPNKHQLSLTDELLLQLDLGTMSDTHCATGSNVMKNLLPSASSKSKPEAPGVVVVGGVAEDNLLNLDIDIASPLMKSFIITAKPPEDKPKVLKPDPLDEIGLLSKQLMEEGLRRNSNQGQGQISQPEVEPEPDEKPGESEMLDLENFQEDKPINNTTSSGTLSLLDLDIFELDNKKLTNQALQSPKNPGEEDIRKFLNSVKTIDLEDLEPIPSFDPIDLLSADSITLTLTFTKAPGFPTPLRAGIITLTNKNVRSPLHNYVLQLIPPRGVQVKLLPPSGMELPPWKKTFLPPPSLIQVALISSLSPKKIRYILSYSVDDETALHNGEFELEVPI